jgi:glycosyltransferase involved in cell wall biosynthesis
MSTKSLQPDQAALPSISVIIPSLNQDRYIERAIRSVIEQDYPNKECIVIDGGSKDATVAVLKIFGDAITWVSETDRGQSHAINKGIDMSRGEIIGWLNSDDTYVPGALAEIAEYFATHKDVSIAYGKGNFVDEADHVTGEYPTKEYDYALFRDECFICQPSLFFRRDIYEEFGGLNEDCRYAMDFEYWLRIGRKRNMVFLDKLLANYRLHRSSITMKNRRQIYEEVIPLVQREFGQVSMKWLESYSHFLVSGELPDEPLGRIQNILRKMIQWLLYIRYNHRRVLARLLPTKP